MTNLEILIQFLNLEGSEKTTVIIDYFDNQNSNSFIINNNEYLLFTMDELEDKILEIEEIRFDNMLDYLEGSEYWKISRYLESDKYIRSVISNFEPERDSFDDMEYFGESNYKFIYLKY